MAEVTTYTPTGGKIKTGSNQASMLASNLNVQRR